MISQQMLLMVTRNMFPCTETSSQAFGQEAEWELKQFLKAAATPGNVTNLGAKEKRKYSMKAVAWKKHTLASLQLINAAI